MFTKSLAASLLTAFFVVSAQAHDDKKAHAHPHAKVDILILMDEYAPKDDILNAQRLQKNINAFVQNMESQEAALKKAKSVLGTDDVKLKSESENTYVYETTQEECNRAVIIDKATIDIADMVDLYEAYYRLLNLNTHMEGLVIYFCN